MPGPGFLSGVASATTGSGSGDPPLFYPRRMYVVPPPPLHTLQSAQCMYVRMYVPPQPHCSLLRTSMYNANLNSVPPLPPRPLPLCLPAPAGICKSASLACWACLRASTKQASKQASQAASASDGWSWLALVPLRTSGWCALCSLLRRRAVYVPKGP